MSDRPPRAMILAAGFGTRLGSLTQVRPKPMLPIAGAPLVRWAVLWLRHHGVRDIVVNLHHLGEQIAEELQDGSELGVRMHYSHEEGMILGTGGGVRHAREFLDDGSGAPIVLVNGKLLFELDLNELLATHRARGAEATMVVRPDKEGTWGASLGLDESSGMLSTFLGESQARGGERPVMFTGIHVVEPRFLDRIPREGEQCIVRTAYREIFSERDPGIGAMLTERYWWEHSTTERYLSGIASVLEGRVDLPWAEHATHGVDPSAVVDPSARIVEPVFVGPGARVEAGAVVGPRAQIGAGARVAPGVKVVDAAVWPGASADADLTGAVAV